MCVCVVLSESIGCMCAQWTLFDLGFDSPNIAMGMQWIHVHVCKRLCECVCGGVQGYPLAKANEIWHPAPHPVRSSSTRTRTHKHRRTRTHISLHTPTCTKHFNTQTMQHEGLCVYSLSCGQDPRGCLLGSLGPALRDVINQFRERWGERQEESRGELVQ